MEQQYKTDAEIYAVLEREIIDLTIRPGSSLSENPLCARFGAPRSLIRVVLQKLQENGLVRIVPYKGTTVTRLNRRIVDELIYERTAVVAGYYLCPACVSLAISGLVCVYVGGKFDFYTGVRAAPATYFLISSVLFFGIYLVYFIITYIGFCRNVEEWG